MSRWRFVWGRSWIERQAVREADMIMREATRADAATSGPGAASEAQKSVVDAGKTFQEVKEWAISEGLKTAAGKDISPSAPRLGEDVWKRYAEAHDITL